MMVLDTCSSEYFYQYSRVCVVSPFTSCYKFLYKQSDLEITGKKQEEEFEANEAEARLKKWKVMAVETH